MSARPHRRTLPWAGLLAVLLALPASGAQVQEMRVGRHPTFTRVVFELDHPAGYQLDRRTQDGETVYVVKLDAGASARTIRSASPLMKSVSLQGGPDRSSAVIRLRQPDLRLKEMILGSPPRIVLDVMGTDTAMAPKPKPKAKPAPQVAAAEKPPEPAKPPAPAPAPQAAPKPKPAPKAEAKPAPKPEPKAAPKPAPAVAKPEAPARPPSEAARPPAPKPVQVAKAEALPKPEPEPEKPAPKVVAGATPPSDATTREREAPAEPEKPAEPAKAAEAEEPEAERLDLPKRNLEAEQAARRAMEERLAAARKAAEERAARRATEEKAEKQESKAKPAVARSDEGDGGSGGVLGTGLDAMTLGSIAGAALLLIALVVMLARRRSIPNDIDVTTLAEERGDVPPGGVSMDADASGSGDLFSEVTSEVAAAGKAAPAAPISGPGLFDEEQEKGEDAMEQDMNLPMDRGQQRVPVAPVGAGAGSGDIAGLVREMERRIAQLETRLEEETDARERLERQVAAQSEELRVQRAAIARTQRALRGLTRSDEDQATEPALRDPR